jgi:hypothetical protein
VQLEHWERVLTSENEGLERDLGAACIARDAVVKDKDLI